TVSISGAVKDTLTTLYSPTLTLGDMIRLAGGFTISAALNRVDVFRLGYGENGTGYTRFELEVDTAFNIIAPNTGFNLMPFDKIAIRNKPLFNLNRNVQITGGVKYPGLYALEAEEVHLSQLIKQAGGFSAVADKQFATLYRSTGNKGLVGINLKKSIARSGSNRFDPVLLPGDSISIPDYQNTVGIRVKGTNQADMVRLGTLISEKSLSDISNFMYSYGRSAKWYIREYAGGFSGQANRNSVTVSYPDGSARGVKHILWFIRTYPTVKPGAIISLNEIEKKLKSGEDKKINWDNIFSKILAVGTTMAILITATK
ncbi:MAG: hypothetical protein FJY19_05815, partial [Bacteroidetes bacterium]|nr:hypothetical protein [Bacteroidota bacterium]